MDYNKLSWQSALKKILKDVQIAERSLVHDDEENQRERRDQMKFREEYFSRTQRRLHSFKKELGAIKDRLDDICHGRASAETIQPMLESYERKLKDFKLVVGDEFLNLLNEEEELTIDVKRVENRLDGWMADDDDITRNGDRRGKKLSRIATNNRLQQDLDRQSRIGAIDKQMANMGGRTGGWDHRDHDIFIKVWTQLGCCPVASAKDDESSINIDRAGNRDDNYLNDAEAEMESHEVDEEEHGSPRNTSRDIRTESRRETRDVSPGRSSSAMVLPRNQVPILLRRLLIQVPGKDENELADHTEWYLQFLSLSADKKRLLSKWKEQKTLEDKNDVASLILSANLREGRDTSTDALLKDAAAEIEERANARLKVSEWRSHKDADKELALMKDREAASRASKLRGEEVKRRQTLSKAQLEQWREAESSSQAALKKAEEETARLARRTASVDPAEVRRRQQRDMELTRQRTEQLEAYKQLTRPRSQIISEINAGNEHTQHVTRDPQRLLARTKASISSSITGEHLDQAERRRNSVSAHSSNIAMSGRDLKFSSRAIPAWRQAPT